MENMPLKSLLYQHLADDTSVGIVVSDTQTHEICYANRAFLTMMHIKDTQYAGKLCYQYIRHLSTPCANCAANTLKEGESHTAIHYFAQFGLYLSVKSVLIQWNGRTFLAEYNTDITDEYQKNTQREALLNLVPNGIGIYEICDKTAKQLYMNDSFYRMVGEARELREVTAKRDFLSFVYPGDLKAVYGLIDDLSMGANAGSINHRILCADGDYRWFRLSASVIQQRDACLTVYCSYTDYEDTVQSHRALQRANAALQAQYEQERIRREVLEQGCIAADRYNVTQDIMQGSSTQTNGSRVYERPYTLADAVQLVLKRIPLQSDQEKVQAFFDRGELIKRFARGENESVLEYRSSCADGALLWKRATVSLVKDPLSDDLIAYTYIYDIDFEKKKQLAMACVIEEEIEFLLLVNARTGAARFVQVKPSCTSLQNVSKINYDELERLRDLCRVVEDDLPFSQAFFNLAQLKAQLENQPVYTATYRCMLPNGKLLRKKGRAFYLDDTHEDIVVIHRDITDLFEEEQRQKAALLKAVNEANAANQAKSEFLSRMSHDIRTPMNGIIGLTQLIRDCDDETEKEHYLADLDSSSHYLLGLVNDILTMSKISEGKVELKPEAVEITAFIDGIVQMALTQAQEKGVEFSYDLSGAVSAPYQYFDPLRVQQIIINILNNAIKYTPAGGSVHYTYSHLTKDGRLWCRHVVKDNGVGMSAAFMETMFDPFSQETNSQSSLASGTGLGLSICQKLCRLMDGEISAQSTLGQGSVFTVDLPTYPITQSEYEQRVKNDETTFDNSTAQKALNGKHILLCEDNKINQMITTKQLDKVGILTDSVMNGKLGVECFAKSAPYAFDAILMDIRMPVMDGLKAAKMIRSLERPDAKSIPIIAMSANAFDNDVNASLGAGMNAHLAKPVDPLKLFQTLAVQIAKRKE